MKKRKIAFFDIDGTIRDKSLSKTLFDLLCYDYRYRGNNFSGYNQLKNKAKQLRVYYKDQRTAKGTVFEKMSRDELFGCFGQVLVEFVMIALEDYSKEEVFLIGERIAKEFSYEDYLYSSILIEELKSNGFELVAISGSPEFLVKPFSEAYGFTKAYGQKFILEEETSIYKPIDVVTFRDKHLFMERYLKKIGVCREEAYIVSIGDTAGDATMLQESDVAFAMNPSLGLAELMKGRIIGYCEINPGKGFMRTVDRFQTMDGVIELQQKLRTIPEIRSDIRQRINL